MKRVIAILLACLLAFSLVGCKSKAERELEEARKAADAMEKASKQAQRDYDGLLNDIEDYERAVGKIKNAGK